jgi:branched-chain amino acid transport system ATP-binding protein
MTCLENLMIGALYGKGKRVRWNEAVSEGLDLLNIVGMEKYAYTPAYERTLHERKMLEVARALATKPAILLIDEAVAGLTPTETDRVLEMLQKIRTEMGVTVFMVEHVMRAVMAIAERIIVIHHGEKLAEGTPKEIANNLEVIDAYLGEKYSIKE